MLLQPMGKRGENFRALVRLNDANYLINLARPWLELTRASTPSL